MTPTLGLAIVASRLDMLPQSVPAMLPYFDDAFILIDGVLGNSDLWDWANESGLPWAVAKFPHRADRCFNLAGSACTTDWIYQHDSDETVTGVEFLRDAMHKTLEAGQFAVAVPRRHWLDTRMEKRAIDIPFPDYQCRLRDVRLRNKWRVHPEILLPPTTQMLAFDIQGPTFIEHFNFAMRSEQELAATTKMYESLVDADYADGRKRWFHDRREEGGEMAVKEVKA
jgi:hypothetical protein